MENFMDRLYSRISNGAGPQYSAGPDTRRRENSDKVEQLMSLMRENDSKQLECIAAMFSQESEDHAQSREAMQQSLRLLQNSVQQSLQESKTSLQNMDSSLQSISESMRQLQTEQSYEQPTTAGISAEQLQDIEEHIHKENVKCYRNVQASVMEQSELQMEQTRNSVGAVKGMLITSLILNVATIAILIVHLLGVI